MSFIVLIIDALFLWTEIYIICFGVLNVQRKKKISSSVVFTLLLLAFYVIIYFILGDFHFIGLFSIIFVSFSIATFIEMKKQILLIAIGIIAYMVINAVVSGLYYRLANVGPMEARNTTSLVFNCISLCAIVTISFLCRKLRKNIQINFNLNFKQFIILFFALLAALLFVDSMFKMYFFNMSGFQQDIALITASISVMFFVLVLIYAMYMSAVNHRRKIEALEFKAQIDKQSKYYEALLKQEEATRAFRHDVINHLSCIMNFMNKEEIDSAKEYIETLINKTAKFNSTKKSGNKIVDIVINDIFGEREDVTIEWKGRMPDNITIERIDLTGIFYNLLSNAVCAAEKCSEDKEEINASVKSLDSTLMITIENFYVGDIVFGKDGLPVSTKEDKDNHGYGSKNIDEIVKKYNGILNYSVNEKFIVQVTLLNVIY